MKRINCIKENRFRTVKLGSISHFEKRMQVEGNRSFPQENGEAKDAEPSCIHHKDFQTTFECGGKTQSISRDHVNGGADQE